MAGNTSLAAANASSDDPGFHNKHDGGLLVTVMPAIWGGGAKEIASKSVWRRSAWNKVFAVQELNHIVSQLV